MKGVTELKINQETMIAAIQKYFIEVVFDASQLARVVDVIPNGTYPPLTYTVTIDSTESDKPEGVQ